jgi:hypothetical protein
LKIVVKNSGSGNITINTLSGQTIDGSATATLSGSLNSSMIFESTGANWIITALYRNDI